MDQQIGSNKAIAAGSAGGLAGALVTVGFALWGHDASPEVAASVTTIVGTALAVLGAYFTPHSFQQ